MRAIWGHRGLRGGWGLREMRRALRPSPGWRPSMCSSWCRRTAWAISAPRRVIRLALVVTALDRTRQSVLGKGRFATLDNLVDTATGTVKAKARFDNAGAALFANHFVNVQLLLRHVAPLVVPVTAVRTGPNGDYVYVIDQERKVSLRKVRRGQASVELMAITEGLAEGV